MPSWNQTATFRISAAGVSKTMRQLSAAEDHLQEQIEDTLDDLRRPIKSIFQEQSVSNRVGDGLKIMPFGVAGTVGFQLVSTYRDPRTGFDPLGVTRFGHRKKYIVPREDRFRSSTIATKRPRGPEFIGHEQRSVQASVGPFRDRSGARMWRHKVKGQQRQVDWVDIAVQEVTPLITEASTRLGRRIRSRVV